MKETLLFIGGVLTICIILLVFSSRFGNWDREADYQLQNINIDGHLIPYDSIADMSKLDDHLYVWTVTYSGWRDRVNTRYRDFKMSRGEVNRIYKLYQERVTK